MRKFSLKENGFPFRNSIGGLYLNDANQSMPIANTVSKKYFPDGSCLIELDSEGFKRESAEKWAPEKFITIKDSVKKCKEIRERYVSKLVDLGCFNLDEIRTLNISKLKMKKNNDNSYLNRVKMLAPFDIDGKNTLKMKMKKTNDTSYLTRVKMLVPFDIDGKKVIYSNLIESRFYYHVETDRLIECMYSEFYVYNAKMFFLTTDVDGLELLNPLKKIEIASTETEQNDLIEKSIYERLYKKMIKKIGMDVSMTDFKINFDSYRKVYEMWRV